MIFLAHINAQFTMSAWPGLLPMEYLYCSSGTEIRGSAHLLYLHLCMFYVNRMAIYLYFSIIFRVEAGLISFHSHRDVEYDGWGCQTPLQEVNKRKAKELIQRLALYKLSGQETYNMQNHTLSLLFTFMLSLYPSCRQILPQTNLGPSNTLVWL